MKPLHVLMAASEALPFVKTGGLGDVLGALPPALARRGVRVKLAIPYYREIDLAGVKAMEVLPPLHVDMGGRRFEAGLLRVPAEGYDVYLVRHDHAFGRAHLYGPGGAEYADNAWRFALFCRAVAGLADRLEERVDLVHLHDWQAALVPYLLGGRRPSVFTIHNIGYQGVFPAEDLPATGLPRDVFHPEGMEFYGRMNFLKAGVAWSDAIITVSPRYAREIQEKEMGCGLDGFMRKHAGKLRGILNGADYAVWNPATDVHLAANYGPEDLSGKAACKSYLREVLRLPGKPSEPLIGMTTRLVHQKGIDLVLDALPGLVSMGFSLALLGSGEPRFEGDLRRAAGRLPGVSVVIGFDEGLAHRIMAGADIFLMPSRYEPCGLSQMYAMKYGTVPVVRPTGGLADTVRPYGKNSPDGVGFTMEEETAASLLVAAGRAKDVFGRRDEWLALMRRGMALDFSWDETARRHLDLYRAVAAVPGRGNR